VSKSKQPELPDRAFAASGGSLVGRIRPLAALNNENQPATARRGSGLALLGIGLVLIFLGVRILVSPTLYLSSSRIRVEHGQPNNAGWRGQPDTPGYAPWFIQTEFEVIQSQAVLGKVIQGLDLNDAWGRRYARGQHLQTEETMDILKSRLALRIVPNTSLIEIRVFDEEPDEAAKIANGIAEAYKAQRYEQFSQLRQGGVKALEARLAEQDEKVSKAQELVDKLRVKLGIKDAQESGEGSAAGGEEGLAPVMTTQTLRELETKRIETKAEFVRQATLLERLKSLTNELGPEGLAPAISAAVPDAVLSALVEQLGTAQQRLVSLSKESGPQSQPVIEVKSVIDDLQDKTEVRVNALMLGLEAKTLSLSNSLAGLNQEVQKATVADIERANRNRPYFEAKRNLEELRRFRKVLEAKIASGSFDADLPKMAPVEIVDNAVPARHPASPNVRLALGMIACGVLLDIAGLLLLTRQA
jgi:polysaccharide biosynthesis transport protein